MFAIMFDPDSLSFKEKAKPHLFFLLMGYLPVMEFS